MIDQENYSITHVCMIETKEIYTNNIKYILKCIPVYACLHTQVYVCVTDFLPTVAINTTYPAGHIVLSLLVLMAFNVGFGCIAGILTMIEVVYF